MVNTMLKAMLAAIAIFLATPSHAQDDTGQAYVAQPGDTLDLVAVRFFENALAYPSIVEANNAKALTDPTFALINTLDRLHPGQKIWIPAIAGVLADDGGAHEMAAWGYQGPGGPARWGSIEEPFATCDTGRSQSPVSVPADAPATSADLAFDYRSTRLNVVNNGHTVQVNHDAGSFLSINGTPYEVAQFHFHAPSENTIEGVAAALEMHIVHIAEDDSLAVVAVLFDIGDEDNPFLAGFWDVLPAEGHTVALGSKAKVDTAFDLSEGLTSFTGSLTTPPCSEDVTWLLVRHRETLSKQQLADFVSLIGLNARPTQPLNGRVFGDR